MTQTACLIRRRVLLLVLLPLGILLNGCLTFQVSEENFIRPTPGLSKSVVTDSLGASYSLRHMRIPVDDATLQAALIRHSEATRTVLYFGGNRFRMCNDGLETARALTAPGHVNLLLVNHRGYGKSTGVPTLTRLKDDALAVHGYVTDTLGTAPENLVVHGMSLGSILAGHVAAQRKTAGLVLESSATTVEEWARSAIPWYGRPFVRLDVADHLQGEGNRHTVQHLDEPLLLLVGADDQQTKPVLSRRLYEAAALPERKKELYVLDGSGHGDVIQHAQFARIYEQFLARAASSARIPSSPDTVMNSQ